MKIPNPGDVQAAISISLARIVSEDSQLPLPRGIRVDKSSKDS